VGAVGRTTVGVDIGQRVDPTAICVVEHQERVEAGPTANGRSEQRLVRHHIVRHLERLPLGTPYPEVAARLARVAGGVQDRTGRRPTLYIDATGVGKPVVDELRLRRVPAVITAVYFTHGDRRMSGDHGSIILGKAWLVSRLQILFQGDRLHLPPGHPEAEVLVRELLDYEIRVDQNANDKYGAFKVGTHDDLVTALGLAVQTDGSVLADAFRHAQPQEERHPADRRPAARRRTW